VPGEVDNYLRRGADIGRGLKGHATIEALDRFQQRVKVFQRAFEDEAGYLNREGRRWSRCRRAQSPGRSVLGRVKCCACGPDQCVWLPAIAVSDDRGLRRQPF
jgi:hypothetical protein